MAEGDPVQAAAFVSPEPARALSRPQRRVAWLVGGSVVVLGGAIAALVVFLPHFIRQRVIQAAQDAGIHLTIQEVDLGFSGVSLHDVQADVPTVPGIKAQAREIVATGLYATNVRVLGATLDVDAGPEIVDTLTALADQNRSKLSSFDTRDRTVSLESARMAWRGLFGANSAVEAGAVDVTMTLHGSDVDRVQGHLGRFDLTSKGKPFGPWSGTFTRTEGSAPTVEANLVLDPSSAGGGNVTVKMADGKPTTIDVDIPKTPFFKLGVRPSDLGASIDDGTEVEARMTSTIDDDRHVQATTSVKLHRVHAQGVTNPIDVSIDGSAAGKFEEPLALSNTKVAFGPFVADVHGTLTLKKASLRVDARYDLEPLPCADLVRNEAKKMGTFVSLVQDLAESTGFSRVTGHIDASGIIEFDSTHPDQAVVSIDAKNACNLSLFGN